MRPPDDYRGGMAWGNEISHEEAEAVLSGTLSSSTAGGLVGVMDEIRREAGSDQSAFIATFARIAAAEAATSVVAPSAPAPRSRFGNALALVPVRRAAATLTSAMLVVASLAGVAVAADHAGPGDMLYGLDRALEAIGIGSGGASERLAEAKGLIDNGEYTDGLSHATDVLESSPANQPVFNAIAEATARLEATTDSPAVETTERVATLLQYLTENATDNPPGIVPDEVVSLARAIAPDVETPAPDVPAPPTDPPADLPGSDTGAGNRSDNPSTTRPPRP